MLFWFGVAVFCLFVGLAVFVIEDAKNYGKPSPRDPIFDEWHKSYWPKERKK